MGLRARLNPNDGSNGRDIGNRWWSCVNLIHIGTGMARAPVIIPVTVKGMMPGAIPAIGVSMGVVIIRVRLKRLIWFGLGAQGA